MGDAETDSTLIGEKLACARGGRLVFAGLDFTLSAGGLLLLKGPNGSGKSSLLRLLAGLARASSGRLLWNSVDISEDPEAHAARLLFIGHQDAIKPPLTAFENLRFWARLRDPGVKEASIREALERFGLDDLADRPARFLSAGQRRRVALARLLAVPAPLWLLDEPANALDEHSEALLARALAEHRTQGGMAVIATHGALAAADANVLSLDSFRAPALLAEAL